MSWTILGSCCGVLVALCAIIDKFQTESVKKSLHERLLRLWCYLDEVKVSNIAPDLAKGALGVGKEAVASRSRLFISAICLVLLSIVMTSQALSLGLRVDHGPPYEPLLILNLSARQAAGLISANILFDCIALGLTVAALSSLSKTSSLWGASKVAFMTVGIGALVIEKSFGALESVAHGLHLINFYAADWYLFKRGYWPESLYASRMVIPLMAFIICLAFLFLAKVVIQAALKIARYVIQIEAEKKPHEVAPFVMLSVCVSLVGCFGKLMADIYAHH